MNKGNLIGKKVRGFKFEGTESNPYNIRMDVYIGKIGKIEKIWLHDGTCRIDFDDDYFTYPLSEIEHHLVDEKPKNEVKVHYTHTTHLDYKKITIGEIQVAFNCINFEIID